MSTEPSTIAVSWPPLALGEAGWRRRLEAIADEAEALVGKPCGLQQSAEMALELVGLIWPAISAEVVAETARASLVVGYPGVLAAGRPMDQCAEIAARLDASWQAAQTDPAAAMVSVPAPILNRVQKDRKPRRSKQPEPLDLEPAENSMSDAEFEALVLASDHAPGPVEALLVEHDADPELPPPWSPDPEPAPLPQRPVRQLRPAHERMARRAVEPEPEPQSPVEPSEPAPLPVVITPVTAPPQPTPSAAPPPASWLTGGEVAELLGVPCSTVARWRRTGRTGAEGTDWFRHGRSTYFDPDVIERLEQPEIPAGLDDLIAEVQAQ